MANTYNDVQNSRAAYAMDDPSSETADGDLDLAQWKALQQMVQSTNLGGDLAAAASEQSIKQITSVTKAASDLSHAQSVANIHVMNANFIRDSITGK